MVKYIKRRRRNRLEKDLTADEIKEIDEIRADTEGVEKALRVATNYAANRYAQLYKDEKDWWEKLAAKHGLDLKNKHYSIKRVNGCSAIVEIDEDEYRKIRQ